ncbi:hypothetical protein EDF57_103211 [Novosphingobium sp. PhB55]|uniref:hypothetical protein n=1 Tax=Novosphingobium sp. PhB55 TaxID=2485106 RepID=UPI0010657732|nr:hypothetical protein [Novosphingobium sp. PhB55]TDW65035.1 hypothetical protein EDF57_103211 [Novosphingobium sp. PhB55]
MNRVKKKVTVSFFSIEAADDFFRGFISSFKATRESAKGARVFNLRSKKHLIKASNEDAIFEQAVYAVTVVKERNTWQTKATSDGKISGFNLNQGIIGDPYFFLVVPDTKLLLGFTSGPSGSLRGVAGVMLEQFNSSRSNSVELEFLPKEKDGSALHAVPRAGELHLRIGRSAFAELHDEAPQIIKDIGRSPLMEHDIQLALNLEFSDQENAAVSRNSAIELISYFADNEGCKALKVKGMSDLGDLMRLDFSNAFFNYTSEILTRQKYIEEESSLEILHSAFREYTRSMPKSGSIVSKVPSS